MRKQIVVALGAGLASALLFAVSAKGTSAASLIAYFTALPIMIAALGFGHITGLAGAVLGSGAVAFGLGPLLAAFYALCFAMPGWWLAYLALLARPAPATAGAVVAPTPPLVWYPVGRLVTWTAALAALAVLVLGLTVLVRYGSFDEASTVLARRLDEAVEQTPSSPSTALLFVHVLPAAMSASLFLMLGVNMWLAARVAKASDRLRRPWPNVPDGLQLPRPAALLFAALLLPAFTGGVVGVATGTVAATLGIAFALQGLASAHVLTRGFGGRGGILTLIYFATFAIPVAAVALCLIGVVDCLFSLRNRRPPRPPASVPTKGV